VERGVTFPASYLNTTIITGNQENEKTCIALLTNGIEITDEKHCKNAIGNRIHQGIETFLKFCIKYSRDRKIHQVPLAYTPPV
jgi:hypothetical protein